MEQRLKLSEKRCFERELDYTLESTFWEELSIAEHYGVTGVKNYYKTVFDQWKDNLKYLTELVMVLNWKIACWYKVDDDLGRTYDALCRETDAYAMETLKGDDLHYYLSTLD